MMRVNRFFLIVVSVLLLLCGCKTQKTEKQYSVYLQKASSFKGVDVDSARYWVDMELKMNPQSSDGFFYRAIGKLAAYETDAFIRDLDSAIMFYNEKTTVVPLYSMYAWRAGAYRDFCSPLENDSIACLVVADYEAAAKDAYKVGNNDVLYDILCNTGDFCMEAGIFPVANQVYKEALKFKKDDKRALAGYGISFLGTEDEKEGIRILDKCIELYPDYAAAYLNRLILNEGFDVHKAIDDAIMYAKYAGVWPLNDAVLSTFLDDMNYSMECIKREMDATDIDDEKWFWTGVAMAAADMYKKKYGEE